MVYQKRPLVTFAISAIPQNPVIRLRKTAPQALGYKSVKTGDFIVFKLVPLFFSYRHANLSYKAAKLFECAKIAKLTKCCIGNNATVIHSAVMAAYDYQKRVKYHLKIIRNIVSAVLWCAVYPLQWRENHY